MQSDQLESTWKKKITKNYITTENGDKHNPTTTTIHPKRFQSEALLHQLKKLNMF